MTRWQTPPTPNPHSFISEHSSDEDSKTWPSGAAVWGPPWPASFPCPSAPHLHRVRPDQVWPPFLPALLSPFYSHRCFPKKVSCMSIWICYGCTAKYQVGPLSQLKFVVSQPWRLKAQVQGVSMSRVGSSQGLWKKDLLQESLLGLQTTIFLLCLTYHSLYVPLQRHQSYQIRGHPKDLILT